MNTNTSFDGNGTVTGVAVGIVTQNTDPDGLCRVKVRFPWRENSTESYWARLSTPMAGRDRGLVLIPEVGDEVLVAFERSDLRFPFVIGALWNEQDQPPLANSDGKNDKRTLRSRAGHYLLFDDGTEGVVELAHKNGSKVRLEGEGILVKDSSGNQLQLDPASGSLTIQAASSLTIKASSITLDAAGTLTLRYSELKQ